MSILKNKKKIKIRYFSWSQYFITFFILSLLGGLPALMYGGETVWNEVKNYLIWYLVYWAVVAAILWGFIMYQKYKAFDKPMRQLSDAANQVASGDFSICLSPLHTSKHLDYLDAMFKDFNTMVEELGSLETMKSEFISNVSHELKTPLAVIQNYAMGLQADDLSLEHQKEYTNTIITAAKNLTTLITNILSLNKLENQEIILPSEPYNVCRQLYDCALTFEDIWTEKQIHFIANIEDRAYIQADSSMMEIIWRNLLSNAMKFTPSNGSVFLTQTSVDGQVVVTVTDSGIGMAPATYNHIFERFYQGDASHASDGNGLGLALTKRVIELIDGSITVESEVGKGSTFTVKIKAYQN
ncbi:HAMP domain-containing sensor histidine kinase [Carnobacterium maltaromaticum]|uniref:HAMP domain-containing sensor histidine kinase n=1 Tax=Carnobacterium maltaromaticum TaxID=2751 RepID=UPI00295F484F|nr:HAMP domain-containing sensor histidine kinase [Carnobacterium maltaromaticum]